MSHKICLYHPHFYLIHSTHKYSLFIKTFGVWFIISYFMKILTIISAYKIYIKVSWKTLPLNILISEIPWLLLSLHLAMELMVPYWLSLSVILFNLKCFMTLASYCFLNFLLNFKWTKNSCGSLLTSSVVFAVLIYSPSCHTVSCQNSKPTCPFILSLYRIKQQQQKAPTDSG